MPSITHETKNSAVSADRVFAAADYVGKCADGMRIAGFASHWYGKWHGMDCLLTGIVCFKERGDGSVIPVERKGQFIRRMKPTTARAEIGTGRLPSPFSYRATPTELDEIARELGLERNESKSGDAALGSCYDSEIGANTILHTLLGEVRDRLFVAHNESTDVAHTVLVSWDDIRNDSAYGKLYDVMQMRKRLASIDTELATLQSQLAMAIDTAE